MKRMALKQTSRFSKILTVLLLVLVTVSAFCLFVGAEDSSDGVMWQVLDNRYERISGDGVIYQLIELPVGCETFSLAPTYCYANPPEGYEASGSVFSTEHGGYLIGVTYFGQEVYYYCREDMLDEQQAFLNGESGDYVFRTPAEDTRQFLSSDVFYDCTSDLAEALLSDDTTDTVTCDVTLLKDLPKLELRLRDKSGMLITQLGTLYFFEDGSCGFVNYSKLDNSHFDADGYFSYRQGSVTLSVPSPEILSEVAECTETGYSLYASYDYEEAYGEDYYDSLKDSFWVLIVFVGYLLPIAPLTVGLVFANSKKMSHPKRWYIVAGLAALWLLLAVVLTVLILI